MPEKMKFKLLRGSHRVAGATTAEGQRGEGHQFFATDPKNNVIESEVDLVKKFGRDKFKRLGVAAAQDPDEDDGDESDDGEELPAPNDDGLDKLTDPELLKFAEEAGVKTKGKSRDKVIELVRESLVNA